MCFRENIGDGSGHGLLRSFSQSQMKSMCRGGKRVKESERLTDAVGRRIRTGRANVCRSATNSRQLRQPMRQPSCAIQGPRIVQGTQERGEGEDWQRKR